MSEAEERLALLLDEEVKDGLSPPSRQYPYIPGRRFRADFAWPRVHHRLLVEVEGGIWNRKAHGSITGILHDIEKHNTAMLAGWRVLRVTPEMIENGEAVRLIKEALE